MSNAKNNLEALESRIGLMSSLANIIAIDRMRDANEGEAPVLNDYYYGALIEAIEVVADSCYEQLDHLDEKVKQGADQ